MSSSLAPSSSDHAGPAALRRMLASQRIAIVGLSDDPARPSHGVAAYLASIGKTVVPVNPSATTVMGLKSYAALEDIPGKIDLVDVFRRPEFCPDIVRSAIRIGAAGVWLQLGVISDPAMALALEAGLDFAQNRCLKVEHMMAQNRD